MRFSLLIGILVFFSVVGIDQHVNILFADDSMAEPTITVATTSLINYEPRQIRLSNDDEWVPLSREEFKERRKKLIYGLADATTQLLDSLTLGYFSSDMPVMLNLGEKVKKYEHWLKDKFHIKLEIDEDQSVIVFKHDF